MEGRLSSVREYIGRKRLDGLLIASRVDQVYLTGFTGEDGMVLITPRQVYLLSDFRFKTAAEEQAGWARFVMRKKGIAEALAKVARRIGIGRIGVVPEQMTVAAGRELRKALRPVGAGLVYVDHVVADLRKKKDAAEIALVRRAIRIAEEAFRAVRRSIRLGQTELELASRLNYEMGRRGAAGPSFPTIVAEGPNSALPHAEPGARPVRSGSVVLFDWGARVDGYCSDLTRVVFIDKIRPQFRRVYGVVLEAQLRAVHWVRAGRSIRRLDAVARSYIAQCGYGREFGHSLGHGLGLDVHEPPSLNARNKARLESGMVVTIEPGIYVPGAGGVRIEDDVLVRDEGCEVLTTLPRNLEWAVVRPSRR
jgi:Xaa-Pro aminopeptidase